jgi:hypothetical protein
VRTGKPKDINWRRHGLLAFLRLKEWWSFEGLDPSRSLYFAFLAMSATLSDYVSLTVVDFANGRRFAWEHMTGVRISDGELPVIAAEGKWGRLVFRKDAADTWSTEVNSDTVKADLRQVLLAPLHRNRLLSRRIDYNIEQYPLNAAEGTLDFGEGPTPFEGYGYCENCRGVQPRQSTANWLHFWAADSAGVLLDCFYDEGVHHHYAYLWSKGEGAYLTTPLFFGYDPSAVDREWYVRSPDLELLVSPLSFHRNVKRIPPLVPYLSIDYHELLVRVSGRTYTSRGEVDIDGIGKYDHNFNLW